MQPAALAPSVIGAILAGAETSVVVGVAISQDSNVKPSSNPNTWEQSAPAMVDGNAHAGRLSNDGKPSREHSAMSEEFYAPFRYAIARKYGTNAAVVFGRIERFADGPNGICYASFKTIADDVGLSPATVKREVKALVAVGLLRRSSTIGATLALVPDLGHSDLGQPDPTQVTVTPPRSHRPRSHRPTNKASVVSEPNGSDAADAAPPASKPTKAGPGADVYRSVYQRYPHRGQYATLNAACERLGIDRLRSGVQWWCDGGHNPKNVRGMIEVAEFGPGEFRDGKLVRPGQQAVTVV